MFKLYSTIFSLAFLIGCAGQYGANFKIKNIYFSGSESSSYKIFYKKVSNADDILHMGVLSDEAKNEVDFSEFKTGYTDRGDIGFEYGRYWLIYDCGSYFFSEEIVADSLERLEREILCNELNK